MSLVAKKNDDTVTVALSKTASGWGEGRGGGGEKKAKKTKKINWRSGKNVEKIKRKKF